MAKHLKLSVFLFVFALLGIGIILGVGESFSVVLNLPSDNYFTNDTTPTFNFTVSGSETTYNCSLMINSSSYGTNVWCYQETANVSSSCGGVSTGNYSIGGELGQAGAYPAKYTYDGNWSSYSNTAPNGTIGYLYINYTTPEDAGYGSLWQVGDYVSGVPTKSNLTIPESCWSSAIVLKATSYWSSIIYIHYTSWSCYNGTNWEVLRNVSTYGFIIEEAMWWKMEIQNNSASIITANSTLPENTYSWLINCTSGSTSNVSESRTIVIDTTAPNTTINDTSSDWRSANLTFNLTCSDNLAGCNYTLYCNNTSDSCTPDTVYSSQVNLTQEGTNYVRFLSNDSAGNTETVNSQLFRLDFTPPNTTINETNSDWRSSNISFNFSCSDTYSGCDTTLYCNDTNNTCTPSADFPGFISPFVTYYHIDLSEDGTYYIRFLSNDSVSNTESVNSQTLKIDKSPPSVNITLPISNYNSTSTNVTYNVTTTDSLSGMDSCLYSLDSWATNTSFNFSQANYLTANHGLNTLNVACNDSVNNVNSSESVIFYVFTPIYFATPPTPDTNWNSSGNNSFGVAVGLNWSADNCTFEWNGTTNTTMQEVNSTYFNLTKTETTDGNYSYRAFCTAEVNGYVSVSETRYAIIFEASGDVTPPEIYNKQPSGNPTYASTTTSVLVSLNTNEQAICGYSESDLDYVNMTSMTSTNSTIHQHSVSTSSGTSYTYYFRCADLGGNNNTASENISFSVAAAGGGGGGGETHQIFCGDGVCEYPETAEQCPADCGNRTFDVSIKELVLSGAPGTEIRLFSVSRQATIKLTNQIEENTEILVSVEGNDESKDWIVLYDDDGKKAENLSFELVGYSEKLINFNIEVPENTTYGDYQTNIMYRSPYYTATTRISLRIQKITPFSAEYFLNILSGEVYHFNTFDFTLYWWQVIFGGIIGGLVIYPYAKKPKKDLKESFGFYD